MRLHGIAMVRNEADIVEAFVRHNLQLLDGLAIVDHGSVDGTTEILGLLRGEGLALRVESDANVAYRQSEVMTRLARDTLAREDANFAFALDADEFLKVDSRETLERALADVPSGMHALLHWPGYVPDALGAEARAFGPEHLRWRRKAEPPRALGKVIVGRALLDAPGDVIGFGSHSVRSGTMEEALPHARLRRDVVALAHCPVRGIAQLERKVVVGYLALRAGDPHDRRLARHWRDLYREMVSGGRLGVERLREIACNYGLPPDAWRPASEVELVEDPVALRVEQRYPGSPEAVARLQRYTEDLLAAARASDKG